MSRVPKERNPKVCCPSSSHMASKQPWRYSHRPLDKQGSQTPARFLGGSGKSSNSKLGADTSQPASRLSPYAPVCTKSLHSCPTLCDPLDCSPPGSSLHGIIQARILEWVGALLQRIFPTQGPHTQVSQVCSGRWVLYH